jgi:hypothetical protein
MFLLAEITILTGLVIGIFMGVASSVGNAITELWIKPHLITLKDNPKKFTEKFGEGIKKVDERFYNGRI